MRGPGAAHRDRGYAVYMPLLFGEPMKEYGFSPLLWPCVRREFSVLGRRGRSPVADWLRAMACRAFAEMMDAPLIAPVLSQPSSSWPHVSGAN